MRLVTEGSLTAADLDHSDVVRMDYLMQRYCDAPMSLADASLVVLAERLAVRRVFTLDGHFRVYRLNDRDVCDVVP